MTFAKEMKIILPSLTFIARHLLVVSFAILVGCVLWTIAYILLLVVAVIWNQGVGGPLAYPAGIIAILGASIVVGWGIFTPASAIGAVFCGVFQLPRLAAIPVVFMSALVISYLMYWAFIANLTTHSMPSTWAVVKHFLIFLSAPLGVYWWVTEGPGVLFDSLRRWIRHRRNNKQESEQVGTGDAEEAV